MFTNDINQRLGEIDADLETLAGLTDPTEDDAARAEALKTEAAELRQARLESQERAQRIADAHRAAKEEGRAIAGASFQTLKKVDPFDHDARSLTDQEARDAARSILDRSESRHLSDDSKTKADWLIESLDSRMARWTLASSRPEYRSAFGKYITGRTHLLTNDERMAVERVDQEARTSLALADANGGYAVPALLDPSVIYTGNGNVNPIRQLARVETGMDDTWRGVTSAGVTASWDGEGTEVSDDGTTFGQPSVVAYKGQAFVSFSVEIEGDWAGLASSVGELFAIAKDDLETAAFATGDGSGKPTGIITALVANSTTVASNILPDTDGALYPDDVYDMFSALPPRYRPNASWMAEINAINEIRARGDDRLGQQTVNLAAGYDLSWLGKGVYENSGFPAFTGTTGVANIMVVGDFRQAYLVYDRVGARIETVQHLFNTSNNLPMGKRGLIYWFRTGGNAINPNAARLLRNT